MTEGCQVGAGRVWANTAKGHICPTARRTEGPVAAEGG